MKKFSKKPFSVLFITAFCLLALCCFFSCQKADPSPYGNPNTATPTADQGTFTAYVNGGLSVVSFTPVKVTAGNYVILKGVSTYYTVTIFAPLSDGPGDYSFGFTPNLRATVTGGGTTYVSDVNVNGAGDFYIMSINHGVYNATFSIDAADSTNAQNRISVYGGTISNM